MADRTGGAAGDDVASLARSAFVDSMGTAMLVGAGTALVGAVVVLIFLPSRAPDVDVAVEERCADAPANVLEPVGSTAAEVAGP